VVVWNPDLSVNHMIAIYTYTLRVGDIDLDGNLKSEGDWSDHG